MKTRKGITVAIIVAVLIVFALLFAIMYMLRDPKTSPEAGPGTEDVADTAAAGTGEVTDAADIDAMIDSAAQMSDTSVPDGWYAAYESSGRCERVINFTPYIRKCPAVYAWIEIPGTNIDYPIAHCEDAVDPFYFTHDIDGNPSDSAMIITDSMNAGDFSDPVTLVYGQDPGDGTMFSGLHDFRDAAFFEDHDRINIYMDDVQLVYRIYACYIGSSDHILVNHDFNDPAAFTEYFDSIKDTRDLSMNIRDDAKPSFNDHVITLVTHCDDENKRLFVHAVLDKVLF